MVRSRSYELEHMCSFLVDPGMASYLIQHLVENEVIGTAGEFPDWLLIPVRYLVEQ